MTKTQEIKLMIIENFIDHFTSDEKEQIKECQCDGCDMGLRRIWWENSYFVHITSPSQIYPMGMMRCSKL